MAPYGVVRARTVVAVRALVVVCTVVNSLVVDAAGVLARVGTAGVVVRAVVAATVRVVVAATVRGVVAATVRVVPDVARVAVAVRVVTLVVGKAFVADVVALDVAETPAVVRVVLLARAGVETEAAFVTAEECVMVVITIATLIITASRERAMTREEDAQ